MIDHLMLATVAEKLRNIARETNRDDAEDEAARLEYALTRGKVDAEAGGDTELLGAYVGFLATGRLDDLPAESHAALLERLALNPRMLSPEARRSMLERLSPQTREMLAEATIDVFPGLFADLEDAVCRYLCVSTALLFDMEVGPEVSAGTPERPASMVDRFVRRATHAEGAAPLLVNELTETLLDVWTHTEMRAIAEDGLRQIIRQSRLARIAPEYFEDPIRNQARLFESGDGGRLERLLRDEGQVG
jgi:hypothetical protein